ncbi:MAG: putative sugar nucleotidyl transferase [Planctomycetia bacterium]|nr:putative sugar nucleotidyl transferase [Planctomycetia bacterium]
MHIILFEDNKVSNLYPVTTGRPAFSISVGSFRLIDLVNELNGELELIVRPHLRDVVAADFPHIWRPERGKRKGPFLVINARTVPNANMIAVWKELTKDSLHGGILCNDDDIIAACLSEEAIFPDQEIGCRQLIGLLEDMHLPPMKKPPKAEMLKLTSDIIRYHLLTIDDNLEYRLGKGRYKEIGDGLFIPKDDKNIPQIGQYFVSDSTEGPIILESGTNIGPFCFMRGPVYIGPKAKVIEHAAIKDKVAVGPISKVGGEVEASTIEPYTNKQHHGFLGHSYLGSWVNLGAGTCNSDLKNSYNEVCMDTAMGKIKSGMQFLGCVVGDYAKTAINTSIFTGKTIGTCSMNYGFVTTAVPSFVNYARSFGQVTELPVDVMIATQARMFARRNVTPRPCDVQLLYDMYELTQHERQLASDPLSL